ncbi:MAG: YfhO family protein [Bacteroidetes bacterium]|nr:YfhO family protein [Bacteroidota bacterium]
MQPENQLNKSSHYRNSLYYLLLLLVLVWIAYWPISFYIYSLKNDALNYFLPVRKLVSESYHHGILPLWTPYLNLGYPIHGDMQSGVWNPVVQLFSLFGSYHLYTLQLETILYVYASGAGMFYLLKYFNVHPYANLLASVAYMLCGFNSDSAQFLNWITASSCLPFLFLFYYRLLKENRLKWALATSLILFIFFTSAYPADFILSLYLMIALFIWNFYQTERSPKNIFPWKRVILVHLVLLTAFTLLSTPAILSYFQSLPLTERGTGASFEQAMSNSMHPFLLSSYTTPLGVWKMPGVAETDPLERNSYIGLISFILLILSFLNKTKDPVQRFSKWALIIFLLFSLGEFAGVRTISYFLLPLMNTFRHPANAKLFTTFFACLLAAFAFNNLQNGQSETKKIKKAIVITFLILFITWICSLFTPLSLFSFHQSTSGQNNTGITLNLKAFLDKLSFSDIVLINSVLQIVFLFLAWKFTAKRLRAKALLILGIFNCILFTMLFQPFTVVQTKRASAIQKLITANSVPGYPIPDIKGSLESNSKDNEKYFSDIGCLALYNKKIGRSEYRITPSNLNLQNNFWFNKKFRELIMGYPLLYRADILTDTSKFRQSITDSTNYWAFLNKAGGATHHYKKDSSCMITVSKFSPNIMEGTITSSYNGFYVLLQNYYPRWKLYVDNKKEEIDITNISFMGFKIPEGSHHFSLRYEANDIKLAFLLSVITLILIIISFFTRLSKLF